MTAGVSPTLTLRVRAPEALAMFKELAGAVAAFKAELMSLQQGGGGSAAVTRLSSEVKELRAALEATRRETALLQQQSQEKSQRTVRAAADEERAVKQRHQTERDETKKTADAKKKAEDDVAAHQQYLHKVMLRSALMEGAGPGASAVIGSSALQQSRDMQLFLQTHAEEMRQRSFAALQARAQADNEARGRAAGVIQYRAVQEDETRTRSLAISQYRALAENEARTRALGAAQAKALVDNEVRERRLGLAQVAAVQEEEARLRKLGIAQALAIEEDRRRTLAAQRAANNASSAQGAVADREASAVGRSVARGAAAAGGGMFLTYGQNIPALAAAFAVSATVKESIQQGSEFEKQMKFMKIASEETSEAVANVSKQILDLGGKTIFAPLEMAKGMRILAQAGFDIKDSYAALPSVMNLAAIGEQTVGQAAETAAGLMHAFGLEAQGIPHIADAIAKAANLSQTNVNEMSQAMRQASTVAQQYNVSIDEMAALLAVLAQRNIRGSAAGTSLMNLFRELDPASATARRAFKQLNIEVTDGEGNFKKIIPLVQEFAVRLQDFDQLSQSRIIRDYLNNRADKGFFAAVAQANKDLPKFYAEIGKASEGLGYAQKSVDELGTSVSFLWEKLKGGLSATLIKAFDTDSVKAGLKDIIQGVTDPQFIGGVTTLVSGFTRFFALMAEYGPRTKEWITGWGGPLAGVLQTLRLVEGILPERVSASTENKGQIKPIKRRQLWDDEGLPDGPLKVKAPAGTERYNRLDTAQEAIEKSREHEIENKARRELSIYEAQARQALTVLDTKHKYMLISEEEYQRAVAELEERRAAKEKADIDSAVAEARKAVNQKFQLEQNRVAAETRLRDLEAKQQVLAVQAAGIVEKRQLDQIGQAKIAAERADKKLAQMANDGQLEKLALTEQLTREKSQMELRNRLRPEVEVKAEAAAFETRKRFADDIVKIDADLAEARQLMANATKANNSNEALGQQRVIAALMERKRALESLSETEIARARENARLLVEEERSWTFGWREAFAKYADAATDAAQHAREMFSVATRGMEDAIVKFAMTGKLSFRDFANTVIQELIRIQVKKAATGILGLFDGFKLGGAAAAGSTGAASAGAGDLIGLTAAMAHTGGVVGQLTASRAANAAMWIGAPRFHGGGISGDEQPVITKVGEGIFTEGQMRKLAPVGSGEKIQINVYVDSGTGHTETSGSSAPDAAKLGKVIASKVREVMLQEKRQGGLLSGVN